MGDEKGSYAPRRGFKEQGGCRLPVDACFSLRLFNRANLEEAHRLVARSIRVADVGFPEAVAIDE